MVIDELLCRNVGGGREYNNYLPDVFFAYYDNRFNADSLKGLYPLMASYVRKLSVSARAVNTATLLDDPVENTTTGCRGAKRSCPALSRSIR